MFAVAMLACMTLVAPDLDPDPDPGPDPNPNLRPGQASGSHVQLLVEDYVLTLTGKVAATLLPAGLGESFGSSLGDPRFYGNPVGENAEQPMRSAEMLTGRLAAAFVTRSMGAINVATADCVRQAARTTIPSDDGAASRLIAIYHQRLAFEVRVDPGRLAGGPEAFVSSKNLSDQFVAGDVDYNLGLIEMRLEKAALLSAKMLIRAWHAAGDPHLGLAKPVVEEMAQISTKHVASKNSKVFHKETCPHAARIKAGNVVRFNSFLVAQETGRKPCKTCKPTG